MRSCLRFSMSVASVLAVALLAVATPQQAQAQVVNGSFEMDNCNTTGTGYRLGLSGNDMTGWFIPSGDGVYPWCLQNVNAFNGGPAAQGNQWLVLGRVPSANYSIQQTLNGLSAGNTYRLAFSIASELGCCSVAELSFLSGSSTPLQTFLAPNSGAYWTQWGANTMDFLATSSSVTFQFRDLSTSAGGIDLGLDDVSLSTVAVATPEPATFSLLLIGLAGVGMVARRRTRTGTLAE